MNERQIIFYPIANAINDLCNHKISKEWCYKIIIAQISEINQDEIKECFDFSFPAPMTQTEASVFAITKKENHIQKAINNL